MIAFLGKRKCVEKVGRTTKGVPSFRNKSEKPDLLEGTWG